MAPCDLGRFKLGAVSTVTPLDQLFARSRDPVLVTDARFYRVYANPALNILVGADARSPLESTDPPPYLTAASHRRYYQVLEAAALVVSGAMISICSALELLTASMDRQCVEFTIARIARPDASPLLVWLAGRSTAGTGHAAFAFSALPDDTGTFLSRHLDDIDPASEELQRLSRRELQVLQQLLQGRRVASISRTLFISEHTVRNHLKAIFVKLGVHSQTDLIERYHP